MKRESDVIAAVNPTEVGRESRLWFLESMEQINGALERRDAISHALDCVLSIFRCDRAWLTSPCDPESPTCRLLNLRTSPVLSDSSHLTDEFRMDAEIAHAHRMLRASEGAVRFGTRTANPIPNAIARRFAVQTQICLAIYPDSEKQHIFGVDFCQTSQIWTEQEQRLFEAIGKRLAARLASISMSRALQESHARLQEAQRVAHVGHWEWDLDTDVVVWSDETYRIFGLEPQERPMDLAAVRAMVHPEDREPLYSGVDEDLGAGVRPEADFRIVRPNGEVRTVHALTSKRWSALAVESTNVVADRPYKLFGTIQDITEHTRVEEERQALSRALIDSKARLEEAQRVARTGHYQWDLVKNCMTWSKELYRIYGLEPQEEPFDTVILWGMLHPEDRERVFKATEEHILSVKPLEIEFRIVRPNGEVRTVLGCGTVKIDTSGRPHEMFGTTQDITERKRAEEERQSLSSDLEESKERLEEAQRVAHIGHFQWDLIEDRITWSDELYRVYGRHPDEGPITVAVLRELMHPDDRGPVFQAAEKAILDGQYVELEHRIVDPDGAVRTVLSLGTVKRDAAGHAYEIFGTSQDITARKHTEQALRRSEFYLREGQRLARMGSWASSDLGIRWSDDLSIYWSDEVYTIFGIDPKHGPPNLEEYIALIHPQDRASMRETLTKMHEERCGCDVTKRIIRPDGEVRHVRCVAVPDIELGVFKGFHGTTMDVTEHEQLTQELRREQAYLAEAQRLTLTGSWATNLITRRVHHSSDQNNRLYGFDVSRDPNLFELHYSSIFPEDELAFRPKLEAAVESGADFDVEFRIRRGDGAVRILRGIGHHNPAHDFGEYFGIMIDITEQKHAEKEREKLRQLESDLEHINRVNMMGELTAALAHEIKQPIAALITSANALSRWLSHDPPDLVRARATATRIAEDGNRAAEIINSLRSFYKTGTPIAHQLINVNEVIDEMTVLLATEATRHSVTVHTDLATSKSSVLADRVQLQQVLMNLMLNAIESIQDTGGELGISSGVSHEGHLVISISDAGVGLPKEGAELIFDPFHTTKPQGTGMGLTITRSIVEAYGGRVWATSNSGRGATFHVSLPRASEAHG